MNRFKKKSQFFSLLQKLFEFLAKERKTRKFLSDKLAYKTEKTQKHKFFLNWRNFLSAKTKIKNALFNEKALKLKKRIFYEWRIISSNLIERKEKFLQLSKYINKKLIFNYFNEWFKKYQESQKLIEFSSFMRMRKLKIWFDLWRKIRCRNLLLNMMTNRRNKNIKQHYFQALNEQIFLRKDKRLYYEEIRKTFIKRKFIKILEKISKKYKKIHDYVDRTFILYINFVISLGKKTGFHEESQMFRGNEKVLCDEKKAMVL